MKENKNDIELSMFSEVFESLKLRLKLVYMKIFEKCRSRSIYTVGGGVVPA